jgi:NAD(P)H-nitrite reductase large subunit
MMELDDQLCLCFHVSRRKVINYIRIEKPRKATQLADCFGAGTGCGWCRPFLEKMFQQAQQERPGDVELPSADEYAHNRSNYVREGGGVPPPGATPVDE